MALGVGGCATATTGHKDVAPRSRAKTVWRAADMGHCYGTSQMGSEVPGSGVQVRWFGGSAVLIPDLPDLTWVAGHGRLERRAWCQVEEVPQGARSSRAASEGVEPGRVGPARHAPVRNPSGRRRLFQRRLATPEQVDEIATMARRARGAASKLIVYLRNAKPPGER